MAYFICEKQGRCCPHEFYDSIEQAITDSEDGVPCDHPIEVAPVRHGRWIKESDGGTRCSVCNKRVRDVTGGGDEPVDLSDMPYCPKCGAKMYGGADNG